MASLESTLSLRQLRYFVCVVEQRGFTAASAVLHVAQPSLSRQIAQLEESLGEQLLLRGPEGVLPTEAGRRFYDLARDVLDRVNGAGAELKGIDREPQGRVAAAMPTTCGTQLLTDLIKICKQRMPLVDLQVQDGISSHTGPVLETGMVDFGVVPNADEIAGIVAEDLLREQLFLVRSHDGGGTRVPSEIALAEIAGMPLVVVPRTLHLRRHLERAAQEAGVLLDLRYEQRTANTVAGFVRAGLAATVTNWPSYMELFPAGSAIAQRIVSPPLSRTISMAYPSSRPLNHAARATYELVRELILARVRDGSWRGELL